MSRDKNFLDYLIDPDRSTSHGSSEFAGFWEQKKLLKKSHSGIYIANDLRLKPEFQHLILLSPTGGGKTTKFILNNALRAWGKNNSLLFFDPSGEIHRLSADWLRRKQKFKIVKIDLTNLDGEKYNPLSQITDKSSARIVAQSLINAVYENANNDPFWTESSISVLTLVIIAVVNKIPLENRNLAFVNRLVNKFGHSEEEINSLMELALNEDDFEEYASFLSNSVKVKPSIIATVKSALYIYSDDVLKKICSESSFDLAELRTKKTALFLIQEEHKIPYFKGFWSLFFRQIFESLMTSSEGNDVYCFMDEFANFGMIPDMETIISVIRKKRVHLSLILQSFEQLSNIYGKDKAKVIFENCNSKMFLSGLSHESSKIVSDMLGHTTESYSPKGVFKLNQPLQRISRNLLTPEEVRTLDEKYCLLIHGNHKPMKLKMKAFYQNRTLKKRSKL